MSLLYTCVITVISNKKKSSDKCINVKHSMEVSNSFLINDEGKL